MDFSIDVFDCVAANPKHIFASLNESDRAAVMPDTGAVSSGPTPFWDIGKRLTDARRTLARTRGQAGPGAAALVGWAFSLQVLPVRLLFGFFQESLD
ncbi:MAG: hypothetical protein WCP70_14430 [Methanothrix sp.]